MGNMFSGVLPYLGVHTNYIWTLAYIIIYLKCWKIPKNSKIRMEIPKNSEKNSKNNRKIAKNSRENLKGVLQGIPMVRTKIPTVRTKIPTVRTKIPTVSRKFPRSRKNSHNQEKWHNSQ